MRESREESNPAQNNLKISSLFTNLNTLLHLFVFVLSYLPQSLCKHTTVYFGFLFLCNMVEISLLNQGYPGCTGVEKLIICSVSLLTPLPPHFLSSCCPYLVSYQNKARHYLFVLQYHSFMCAIHSGLALKSSLFL